MQWLVGWLVGWFGDQGKKGVCVGKKVQCDYLCNKGYHKFIHCWSNTFLIGWFSLVSEPDPQKIEKEGLAHRLGWKCTLRMLGILVIAEVCKACRVFC